MKNYIVLLLLLLGVTVVPQSLQAEERNSLYISYNISDLKPLQGKGSSFDFDGGFTLGVNHSKSIAPGVPLFLEVGLAFSYDVYSRGITAWDHIMDYEVALGNHTFHTTQVYGRDEYSFEYWNMSVPINFMYEVPLGSMSIQVYQGVNFKCGLSAKETVETVLDEESLFGINEYSTEWEFWDAYEAVFNEPQGASFSYYDKGYMAAGEEWKRFLVGYQVGANFVFSKFFAGVKYQQDITEITRGNKYRSISIGMGLMF